MDGLGLDLCAGLLYEHRFAMLIIVWCALSFGTNYYSTIKWFEERVLRSPQLIRSHLHLPSPPSPWRKAYPLLLLSSCPVIFDVKHTRLVWAETKSILLFYIMGAFHTWHFVQRDWEQAHLKLNPSCTKTICVFEHQTLGNIVSEILGTFNVIVI